LKYQVALAPQASVRTHKDVISKAKNRQVDGHLHSTTQVTIKDSFKTIAAPAEAEYKDRASKFLGFAYPVSDEAAALAHLEALRKQHFKANHHCFAWRLGTDGTRFRANDDGEPSGTAGRPMLGQIDAADLTDVCVVVVRYFGGTLLGAAGLINAYRETTALTLQAAQVREVVLEQYFNVHTEYALLPDVTEALYRSEIRIVSESFGERATLSLAVRLAEYDDRLLRFKAHVLKVSRSEAITREWPVGVEVALDGL
jgi:uncharacterized YigZ family protein